MSDSPSSGNHSTDGRTRVAVIFGGTSSEHAVSCLTAGGVLKALDPARYDVLGVGITRSGRWVLVDAETMAGLQVSHGRLPELSEHADDAVLLRGATGTDLAVRARTGPERSALAELGRLDVALALLHGPFGEDGTIQGL